MHIVYVTHAYPRRDGDVAGVFVQRLADAVVRRGHRVSVVAPSDEGRAGEEQRAGLRIRRVRYAPARWETLAYRGTMADAARSVPGLTAAALLALALAREARRAMREGAQLIHAHWWVPAGVSAWLARLAGGPPYIVTLHGTDVAILRRSAPARMTARRVLQRAAAVTAVSSYLAREVSGLARVDDRRIMVQPMPIDVARFAALSSGGGGVMVVGRLVAQKRVGLVLDAVSRLAAAGRRVALTVVGDGPDRTALEARVSQLGLAGQTQFVGAVAPDRLPQVLAHADLLAFPGVGEGFGLAAAEALLMGIPVVASRDGGGVTDLVPEAGAGRLVAPGDPAALATAIGELLDDPASRRQAADEGLRLRERLAPERVAAAFETLYTRVTTGSAERPRA